MNSLVMINNKDNGLRAYYNLDSIESIEFGKMKDFYTESDILKNGYKPKDMCVFIIFCDGSLATFKAKEWHIEYRYRTC